VELARTRISGFPWDLLGVTEVDNIPLARIATVTGVYGVSFEIMVVNVAVAAAFLLHRDRTRRERRNSLLLASVVAIVVLQVGTLVNPPALPADHVARLVPQKETEVYNSGSLVRPNGEWVARYDKVHLVPFGEYVPFKRVFAFAGGLTKEVGDFARGTSRAPLDAGGTKLGVFICYESIF